MSAPNTQQLSETEVRSDQIIGTIRRGQSALRRIRCVVGGTWFGLSAVAAAACVFYLPDVIDILPENLILSVSKLFLAEALFDARLLMSSLAPLGDDTRFMQLVLGIDIVMFAARRFGMMRRLSVHWWVTSWSEWTDITVSMAKGVVCMGVAAWAMTRRDPEAMHTWLWRHLVVYATLDLFEACLSGLIMRLAEGNQDGSLISCLVIATAVPPGIMLYLVWDRRLLNWTQSQLRQWVDTTGATNAAASIACAIGPGDPTMVLRQAKAQFRCVTLDCVAFEDVQDNTPNPELYSRSCAITLGRCDAFVSHSWHDDAGPKWDALKAWRASFVQSHGREPTVWFDKLCIDQTNIERDLRCLPIYLGGCHRLVILSGPSYMSRLWCIMELFFFIMMGGRMSSIDLIPVAKEDNEDDAMLTIVSSFKTFDAGACECFFEHDKERMLTVIQTSFGSLAAFNQRVSLLLRELSREVRCDMPRSSTLSSHSSSDG